MSKDRRKIENIKLNTLARGFLQLVYRKSQNGKIAIDQIIEIVGQRAMFLIIVIFSFPLALPLPYPLGLPSIFSIPLLFLSAQMCFGRQSCYLPNFVHKFKIKISLLRVIVKKASSLFKFVDKISRFKGLKLSILTSEGLVPIYGIIIFIFSIAVLIPFPATNFLPSVGIFLISFGLLTRNGVLVVVGIIFGLIGMSIALAIFIFGKKLICAHTSFFGKFCKITPILL